MHRRAAVLSILAIAAVSCRRQPTPVPTAEPPAAGGAELRVISPVVEFRVREQAPLSEVAPGETITAAAAANVVVGDAGRAMLTWPGFLEQDLLSGADSLVSLSEPGARRAILDQAAGTARYTVDGPGEAADVTVQAGWVQAHVDEGVADFIVSFMPGDTATVWLVAVEGKVRVARATLGEDGAPAGSTVTVSPGEGAAFPEEGELPLPMGVDVAAVERWYARVAAGTAENPIASVALRCALTSEAPLLSAASEDADETGITLEAGRLVDVLQRNDAGDWARVATADGVETGWLPAGVLRCMAPLVTAGTRGPEEPTPPASPTVVRPTRIRPAATATATVAASPTPTPTVAAGDAKIDFWADDEEIDVGDCTVLHWKVENIREVYYNGSPKTGEGSSKECPTETTEYKLRVVKRDGSEETKSIEVKVRQPEASPTALTIPSATMAPPTATPSATPVPPTSTPEPPTATSEPATDTPMPPTDTPMPPTATVEPTTTP
ncbi:MAG: hypothetical protein ACE5EL_01055 [Anaerolineae bacterium]